MASFNEIANKYIARYGAGAIPQATTPEPSPAAPTIPVGIDANGIINNPVTTAINNKKASIAAASESKKQALGGSTPSQAAPNFYQVAVGAGNDKGLNTASETEQDLRTMNPGQLWLKYGDRTPDLIRGMAQGAQEYNADQSYTRNGLETIADSTSGIASGLMSGLGGIAALGTGLVSDAGGAAISEGVSKASEFIEGTQSDAVNAARKVQRTKSALTSRDNAQERQDEIKSGSSELVADLRRFGRDFVDTLGNSTDATMLGQGSSEALGSLLAGGPVARGLRAIGTAAMGGAAGQRAVTLAAEIDRGQRTVSAARAIDAASKAGGAAAWPIATGLLEGGGAYTGTVNEIMAMPFDQLEMNSEEFRNAVLERQEAGMPLDKAREEARLEIAGNAGKQAAAIQAPIAGATGFLTKGFEKPFHTPSIGAALRDIAINEPVEEAIQSATGQIAQNIAVRGNADENRTLSEGVGEQSALGALYGFTSAGAVKAPSAAMTAVAKGGRAIYQGTRSAINSAVEAGKPLYQALVDRGDRILRQQESASPVSDQAVNDVSVNLAANSDVDAQVISEAINQAPVADEVKAAGNDYVSSLVQSLKVDPAELEGMPQGMRDVIGDASTRTDAINRMARAVTDSTNEQEVLNNAAGLWFLMEPMKALQEADPVALDSIPADSPARESLRQYNWVVSNIDNNPTVKRALRTVAAAMEQAAQNIQPVSEESLATPEGQQNVQNALAVSALHPDKGNLEANEQILTHAANGRLNLTPNQLVTLQASVGLLRARQKMEAQIAESGIRRAKDVVSSQIVAGNDPLRKIAKSALQHTQDILSAVRGQNTDLAAARLEDFGKFVQHMQNKVEALNTHFDKGDPTATGITYQQLQPNSARDFKESTDGLYVNTLKGASIDQAQSIGLEANVLADVYNGLVSTFPDLGISPIQPTPLAQGLVGNSEEIALSYRTARQQAKTPVPVENTVDGGIPTMITKAMRQELRDMGVPDREIRDMTPADAWNRIQNPQPVAEPVPEKEVNDDRTASSVRVGTEPGSSTESVSEPESVVQKPSTKAAEVIEQRVNEPEPASTVEPATSVESDVPGESESSQPATPVDSLYGENNYVRKAFSYPAEPRTRLYTEESPIASVRRALSSELRLNSFLSGSSKSNSLDARTAEAYQKLLTGPMRSVIESLESNLEEFLDSKYSKSNPQTMQEIYLNDVRIKRKDGTEFIGSELNRLARAKVLNLTQVGEDGRLSYQPQMLEQAALAGMQWLLSAESFMTNMDESDIADMTGVSMITLQQNPELVEQLSEGMSLVQAKRALSDKIRKYWGLTASNTADLAYVDGIPDSMAAEMLRAMNSAGLLQLNTVDLTPDVHGVETKKSFIRVIPAELQDAEQLANFQDAIEVASIIEPEHTNYIGENVPPVAQRQMNNPDVMNTKPQIDALTKEQQTPFYVNPTMVAFYASMGKENLLNLFGTPMTDPEIYNVNDLMSVEGRNKSVTAAYDHLFNVMADISNAASTASTPIDQMPIRYAYNMSRVGRMQMLGKYSPQASKLVREAILPTRATLDLSSENSAQFAAYGLGLAQAVGIKVHNQPTPNSVDQVISMLNGPLKPAVDVVTSWLSTVDLTNPTEITDTLTNEQVAVLKDAYSAAGADLTMQGLHAVVDYARYLASDNKAAYQTSIYLEADGVTNGPINAMALMSIGNFTPEWVSNISKGGLTFGGTSTMADIRRQDSKDLYQSSTDAARARLSELRSSLDSQGNEQMDHLLSLMSLFNKDVLFNPDRAWEDGALELKRGIAKNPLTITIYGSGEAGIAGKLATNLVSDIYSAMSGLLAERKANPDVSVAEAMFPNDPDAANKLKRFGQSITALTSLEPSIKDGAMSWTQVDQATRKFNPQTYTITQSEMEVLQKNMLELFVKPMRQGIADTVGEPLMKAVSIIRDAAQVQSIFYQNMFIKEVDEMLAQKEKSDPDWRRGDFLSRADMTKIVTKLKPISPLVQTGEQTFMISGQEAMQLEGRDLQYGRALNDTLRTDPSIYAPAQAGVRAIPMMTIGMGDGMMMQLLAQAGLEGTLKIFDGMNMPLDKIADYSLQSNAAVYESWKGNPHKEVLKSFDKFLKQVNASDITDEMYDALVQTLFTSEERRALKKSKNKVNAEHIMERIEGLRGKLEWSAKSIDARHQAVDSLPVSLDQMAAAAAPFNNGKNSAGRMSNEDAVAALNAAYKKAMSGIPITEQVKAAVVPLVQVPVVNNAFDNVGRATNSGARILSQTAIQNLTRTADMTESQKVIYDEVRRSLAAKEYKVVVGTPEQLDAYIADAGLSTRPSQDVHGWVNIGDKTIYLVNPTMETLVHELVHAASFETVLAHYNGQDLGTNGKEVADAIGRLETMMADFLSMDTASMDPALQAAYDSARAAILSSNIESDQALAQAKALNEFMAWGLTNAQLTKELKQKQSPSFVQMVKGIYDAIKKLIWGRKVAPKIADDFLSNLQFNSGIVIRSQPSIGQVVRDAELFHSTAYGNSDRINNVRQAFNQKIVDLLSNERWQRGVNMRTTEVSKAQMDAIDMAMMLNANGFVMTPQENLTFRMIVSALATEAEIDKNALSRAQELYTHVTKNLSVESFMTDPESTDPNDRYFAQEKYNAIMGKTLIQTDAYGRSSLLPAFLGLATVSDEFRTILSKMPLPKSAQNGERTLDAVLENVGTNAMDSLSRRLSSDVKSKNVSASVDNLMEHIRKVAQDEQTYLDQYASVTGGIVDRMNQVVVDGVSAASDYILDKANQVEKNASNSLVRNTARMAKLFAAVATEKNGAIVAEGVMAGLNASKVWEPLRTFIGDLVGRTESNSNVYDMIKAVRSAVQQSRQQFRDGVPQILNEKFKKKVTPEQWTAMFNVVGKTDLALLRETMSHTDITNIIADQTARDTEINNLESQIQSADPKNWATYQKKMKQLAKYMNTGVVGVNLLRNVEAISRLLNENKVGNFKVPNAQTKKAMDKLVTLYSLDTLKESDRNAVASLVQSEAEGVSFTLDYLVGQRTEEMSKTVGKAKLNAYKGYIPSEQQHGMSMQIADDSEYASLRERGFVRVAPYVGSSTESGRKSQSYYFAPFAGRAIFNQGIMQNVRDTAGGVDLSMGFTNGMTSGRIVEPNTVARLVKRMAQETNQEEAFIPVFDEKGAVVALERAVNPVITAKLNKSTDLAKMIGVWRGRQAEEAVAHIYNTQLIQNLKKMYDEDMKLSSSNKAQYVDLFNPKSYGNSSVITDAVNLFTEVTTGDIRSIFGDEFWVRKDMVRDAIGERSASVGDLWNGVTNLSKDNQDHLRKAVVGAFGIDAYKYMVKGEQTIQNFMADMRTLIVVKSVIVPAINFVSNVYQLIGRGVPMITIAKGMPRKLGEIDSYAKSRLRQIEAEAELRAVGSDVIKQRKLESEIQSITDAHKRLSIYPLVQAGEFSSIADVGMQAEDLELTSGKLASYIERQVDKLPESVRNAGRYALITKDTALYRGLQKSVQYGDFIAKAVLYDDLTQRLKLSKEDALARITEEFVNYDRLPGRFRSYLENMGILWFYNFKIRSTKVALSTIRNNPIHALMAMTLPAPDFMGSIGSPISDNIAAKALGDSLGYSVGPDMAFRAPTLNPWLNLIH